MQTFAWVGGKGVRNGTIETGAIMAAISYSIQILMRFGMLTNVILGIPRGQISAKGIYEVLDMPLSVKEPDQAAIAGDYRQYRRRQKKLFGILRIRIIRTVM
ncbi:ABC transporter ATP-binding protein [Desulfosporosinus sp. OT]|uniref:ABC transporter ATP-binding protein n=1 Tax=Desulfosporosinus sp. OT TaxID=913865 RepID=UPI000223A84E|nr:ABC transporter ATP-binding protein [Desulfosporosinus sp. OT]EGW41943.1 hypothetical protein DOT_0153 [Desulfosporosinus sp. OT]